MRNCFCKVVALPVGCVLRVVFQSSWMRNCFCKLVTARLTHFPCINFQSSWMRNCFCKPEGPEGRSTRNPGLSILVNEELLLQAPGAARRWSPGSPTLSMLVNEELLLQVYLLLWRLSVLLQSFNPREWGTAFARRIGKTYTALALAFQSSWMRNCFCKLRTELYDPFGTKECFQSSWMRNCFCKSSSFWLRISSTGTFNPREWGTAFASQITCFTTSYL